jgi:hypothetical protein
MKFPSCPLKASLMGATKIGHEVIFVGFKQFIGFWDLCNNITTAFPRNMKVCTVTQPQCKIINRTLNSWKSNEKYLL